MTREEAQLLVARKLREMSDLDIVVLDDATLERPWGWVFFYQSREFLETGEFSARLAGNGPIFVNRNTGELRHAGTALPVETYIEDYEKFLNDNAV